MDVAARDAQPLGGCRVLTKTCPVCGEAFRRHPSYSRAQWERATFCSNVCRGATLRSERAQCECGCGEQVSKPRSRYLPGHNMTAAARTPLERLLARLPASPDLDSCWTTAGADNGKGYRNLGGRYVHALMFEAALGLVPAGMEIDHVCRNRACCNPLHLEAVTHLENLRRAGIIEQERAR